jgi:pimeloyl-ACP methyl ester carboxylesterase
MKIRANGIDIEVEDTGADGRQAGRPVVLLVMGLGMQLVAWPPQLVQALVDAGYRVIRHDNRDIGLSQHFDHLGAPNIIWAALQHQLGFKPKSPYGLSDMALDALGVLDALKVQRAHVVGVSMGGMIAQHMALAAPDRLLSLTSIMSSSGARGLPEAAPEVRRVLMARPGKDRAAIINHTVRLLRAIGSPGFPVEEALVRQRLGAALDRSWHPVGTQRQMVAIIADTGQRAPLLSRIQRPTLVLHGKADRLVPIACGEDTARRIPGARFVAIDGMGHDLPPGVVQRLLPEMLPFMAWAGKP